MNKFTSQPVLNRRRLLQLTAAGVTVSTLGLTSRAAYADYDKTIRWVSPRGTLEVVDDFSYWVAKKYGYFGDLKTDIQGGPQDATATIKLVVQNQSDFGYPSPGVLSLGLNQGMDLVSVYNVMGADVFDFAFQKGKAPASVKGLEGKTIVLGSSGWQSITDPMLAAAGVDTSKVKYVEVSAWGPALAQGQADAALCWEGLRAQWGGQGLDFDYLLGKNFSKFPANSYVIRKADLQDQATVDAYTKYLRGWAMGMEFGWQNPRAATEIVMQKFPALASQMDPSVATDSLMQELSLMHADWDTRKAWGAHDEASWQNYFDTIAKIGQVSKVFKAGEVTTNQLIAGANDFDHAKVKADADAYALSDAYKAVDLDKIKAAL